MAPSVQLLTPPPQINSGELPSVCKDITTPLSTPTSALFVKPILRKTPEIDSSETTLADSEMETVEDRRICHSLSAPNLVPHPPTTQSKHSASTTSLKSIKFDNSLEKCIYWVNDSPAKVSRSPIFLFTSEESLPALLPPSPPTKIVGVLAPPARSSPFLEDEEDNEVLGYLSPSASESDSDQETRQASSGSDDSSSLWMKDNRPEGQRGLERRRRTKRRHEWGEAEAEVYMDLLNGGARGEKWVSVKECLNSPRLPTPWRLTSRSPPTTSRLASGSLLAVDTIRVPSPASANSTSCLVGSILVRNLCFEKYIMVRWTTNGWASYTDTVATFAGVVSGGWGDFAGIDRFEFNLTLSTELLEASKKESGQPTVRFEFAAMVAMVGRTEWDNNSGSNHYVVATRARKPVDMPTKETIEDDLKKAGMKGRVMEMEARRIEREFSEGRRVVEDWKMSVAGAEEKEEGKGTEMKRGEKKTWSNGTVYVHGRRSDPPRLQASDWEEIAGARKGGDWGWDATIREELKGKPRIPSKPYVAPPAPVFDTPVDAPLSPVTDVTLTPTISSDASAINKASEAVNTDPRTPSTTSLSASPPLSPRSFRLCKPKLGKSPSSSSLSSLAALASTPPPPTPPIVSPTPTHHESYGFYAHSRYHSPTHPPPPHTEPTPHPPNRVPIPSTYPSSYPVSSLYAGGSSGGYGWGAYQGTSGGFYVARFSGAAVVQTQDGDAQKGLEDGLEGLGAGEGKMRGSLGREGSDSTTSSCSTLLGEGVCSGSDAEEEEESGCEGGVEDNGDVSEEEKEKVEGVVKAVEVGKKGEGEVKKGKELEDEIAALMRELGLGYAKGKAKGVRLAGF
ncbi:Protein phosphatase 1 regulatory subunit 3E [Chytridiales sp. JEL 0842]|nr:Protein phosphatase 1 regulatory subunit 3E [Chytridiales sp. JEL 0842]